jgi:hypothetical protein
MEESPYDSIEVNSLQHSLTTSIHSYISLKEKTFLLAWLDEIIMNWIWVVAYLYVIIHKRNLNAVILLRQFTALTF